MAAGIDVTRFQDVKKYAGNSSTWDDEDNLIDQLINVVSNLFEKYLDRTLLTGSQTEYFDVYPGQDVFYLKAWPVSAVSSVTNDLDWTASTEVDSSLYKLFDSRRLVFQSPDIITNGRRALCVSYTGGMAATTDAFVAAYPDISGAANMQVWHWRNRVGEEDATAVNIGGGQSLTIAPPADLLPAVKRILNPHRSVHT